MALAQVSARGCVLLLGGCVAGAVSAARLAAQTPDVVFVPTNIDVAMGMLRLAAVTPADVVYDLGSGDGRLVIAAAKKYGARGVGIEIDPSLVADAQRRADTAGVAERVMFRRADLFETDLRQATVVTLYLTPSLNLRLRPKLLRELRPGARVVSNNFDMGDWEPDSISIVQGVAMANTPVRLWIIPADVRGQWTLTAERMPVIQLRLEQRLQHVTGQATIGTEAAAVTGFHLHGDSLAFAIDAGDRSSVRFTGRVTGDSASGTARLAGTAASRGWHAVRTRR